MASPLKGIAPHWPWIALIASLAMLAGAHSFERFGGLYPCPLCLRQREIYWGAIALAAVGLLALRFAPRPHLDRTLNVFLGLAFLTGALIAFYHVAVEQGWLLAQCEAYGVSGDLTLGTGSEPIAAPRCDAPSWRLFGITMAGYNALVSLGLAGLSFFFALASPSWMELNRG
jgi:disulfide bond formation protein DsbB